MARTSCVDYEIANRIMHRQVCQPQIYLFNTVAKFNAVAIATTQDESTVTSKKKTDKGVDKKSILNILARPMSLKCLIGNHIYKALFIYYDCWLFIFFLS